MMTICGRFLVYVFMFVFNFVEYSNADETQLKRLYNCIKDLKEGVCEDSRIIIDGYFYECETVVLLHAPPKRIVYKNGEILLLVEDYVFRYSMGNVTYIGNEFPRPQRHILDTNGNLYFVEDGEAFVIKNNTEKELRINLPSESSFSHRNQIALDNNFNKLFILPFYYNQYNEDRSGKLFTISTNFFDGAVGEINAELVESVGDHITAVAVEDDKQSLLLGIEEDGGNGKFIRMKRKITDPCFSDMTNNENPIIEVFKELRSKIGILFETPPDMAV